MLRIWTQFIPLMCLVSTIGAGAVCNRRPQGANGDRSIVDESLKVLIDGNPPTYIPGQQYNVSLSSVSSLKFSTFNMVVESEGGTIMGFDVLGHFEILDTAETRFSAACENMIENTNTNAKSRIDVTWVAPTNPESGCVLIKASVLQHRNVWFMDSGFLTKRFCPEEIDDLNTQTPRVDPCCACDEAKYEIVIQRNWSRNTHAKDFPSEAWRTRFSELVGASHTFEYRFWEYGTPASRGLQELAEHGATATLEEEIKATVDNNSIRTIIKAPGILYRSNSLGSTLAQARVDPQHHLLSLVTKIEPSPDWILGVAGIELCLANCTWAERKVLNLYPWDIGTDAGPSYMSSDQPQIPPDVVRGLTSSFPSDARSPFYDSTGAPMKPLAVLYITRKKVYERQCDTAAETSLECSTHPWIDWSECSSKCGPGLQTRVRYYKDPRLAESSRCQEVLSDSQNCMGNQCGPLENEDERDAPSAECAVTQWSDWTSCSNKCGKGWSTRSRDYVHSYARERCEKGVHPDLVERRTCEGFECGGAITTNFEDRRNYDIVSNFDEPGLLDEDELSNTRFPTKTRQNFDNIGSNKYNSYDNFTDLTDTYGSIRSMPNNNDRQSFPYDGSNSASSPNAYNKPQTYGQVNVQRPENRYQENLGRNIPQGYNQPSDDISQNFGASYNRRPSEVSNAFGGQNFNRNQPTYSTPRIPSGPYGRAPPYGSQSPRGGNTYSNRDQTNVREAYDDFGRKTVMVAGSEPNNYDVVQEYCFEKPVASRKSCKKGRATSNYWFYDADDRECKIFATDLCDENKNKFRTLEACEGTCHKPQQNLEETLSAEQNNWDVNYERPVLESESLRKATYPREWEQRRRTKYSRNRMYN